MKEREDSALYGMAEQCAKENDHYSERLGGYIGFKGNDKKGK